MSESNYILNCSFCGKHPKAVFRLIVGPSASICDECVEVCNDIIRLTHLRVDCAEERRWKSILAAAEEKQNADRRAALAASKEAE